MKIALINGSPKATRSSSGLLLENLKKYLEDQTKFAEFNFNKKDISKDRIEELAKADVWVFAYPLYLDGPPGHFLSCLIQLHETCFQKSKKYIYGIVNCGFYEGTQTKHALGVLQNWSTKIGTIWGGGVGVGGGGALMMMPKQESGQGSSMFIDKALKELADTICLNEVQENRYVSIAYPRFLYKIFAEMGWSHQIKKNGGKRKDLGRTLDV